MAADVLILHDQGVRGAAVWVGMKWMWIEGRAGKPQAAPLIPGEQLLSLDSRHSGNE